MKTFHKIFYHIMRFLVHPYFSLTGFRYKTYTPKSRHYLVLTNHNTNWDFFLAGLVINRRHMYFVGSEHILRIPFFGPIIRFLTGLIPRKKGGSSEETVSMILQRLKDGSNVCMMAEGNRSFDGKTCFISPRTAQLAKDSGAGLITIAIHGAYFISPRWSSKNRHGRYYGEVVHEYSPEQLQNMSLDEINGHIRSDLYVNAYEDQEKDCVSYRSSALAEDLETALFICPSCKSSSTLYSHGDTLSCSCCGTSVKLNARGYFEPAEKNGHAPVFTTILDWSQWQTQYLRDNLPERRTDKDPIFQDTGITLSRVNPARSAEIVGTGAFFLYGDRFVFTCDAAEISVPLCDIKKISVLLKNTLLFTTDTEYFQLKGGKYSALKYLIAQKILVGKDYY